MTRTQNDYQSRPRGVQGGSRGSTVLWFAAIGVVVAIGLAAPRRAWADDTAAQASSPGAGSGKTAKSTGAAQTKVRAESRVAMKPSLSSSSTAGALSPIKLPVVETPVAQALRMISECKSRFRDVSDYSCDFYKRERINGRLTELHVMSMKERTHPKSIYFKFQQPHRGREAIYVDGQNSNYVLAHDVGFTKFLAGTMQLDPKGARAMENNRHPITEAGIGKLIDNVEIRWASELNPKHSVINHYPEMQVGPHKSVVMIESIHPTRKSEFLYHQVRLYIDQENGLPIRFEAYDWPRTPKESPELVEEYTYLNLKLNVGLKESDFDPANSQYSFGRF
jgi:hypothetical protein